jgi:hypothetical protein
MFAPYGDGAARVRSGERKILARIHIFKKELFCFLRIHYFPRRDQALSSDLPKGVASPRTTMARSRLLDRVGAGSTSRASTCRTSAPAPFPNLRPRR